MDVEFQRKDTRLLCEDSKRAQKKLGSDCARKLRARLADLRAASTVRDLHVGRPHTLSGDRSGQLAIILHGGMRLIIEPHMDLVPTTDDGAINWQLVDEVSVVEIGDYHD